MVEKDIDPRLLERALTCAITRQAVDAIRSGVDPTVALTSGLLAASESNQISQQLAQRATLNTPHPLCVASQELKKVAKDVQENDNIGTAI